MKQSLVIVLSPFIEARTLNVIIIIKSRLPASVAQICCSTIRSRVQTSRHTSEARHVRTCRSATAIEDEMHILLLCVPSL